ncbi:MAG: UPF0158 family protein [Desulfobulbaceae bacterium]|jgi:hypothetical protein|nr:UPF0158 family protein [Desulfobulbaceae bacterium]
MPRRDPRVSLDELVASMFFVSNADSFVGEEVAAYLCRPSGEIFWQSLESLVIELYGDPLPEDVDSSPDYLRIPSKRQLNLGKALVFAFVKEAMPDAYAETAAMFRKPGAYQRFRDLLQARGLLGRWREFQEEGEKEALRNWCREHGVVFKE